jgi:DNA repair exonuclease SbcCD nuclease subunit
MTENQQLKKADEFMKVDLILTSDWHLRENAPVCRTDNFWKTQWGKTLVIKGLQQHYDCPVLHGGDLFHHWKPSPRLLSETMNFMPAQFHTVYGQHDLPQHNFKEQFRSGIFTLETAGKLKVLPGIHWGQLPEEMEYASSLDIPYTRKDYRSVLVWHHMVWQGRRPWPGCTDPSAKAVLKKYSEYDLILTGDNHKPFVEEYQGRLLVNPGSLMRQSADQQDHRPRVYLYNAESNTVWPEYLPIQKDAVSRLHLEEKVEREDRIDAFISKLQGEWDAGLSFEANMRQFLEANNILDSTKQIIHKSMDTES